MAPDPHPASADLAQLDARALSNAYATASTTPTEVVDRLLARIATLDGPSTEVHLNAVLALDPTAREAAATSTERLRRGSPRRLEGVPVLVKDNVEVAGCPTTAGSTSLVGRPPRGDAPLVARLRDEGAIVLGTTNLSEWANLRSPRSASGWSAVRGLVANPWALDRSAGGSSSGSGAAVAASFAPLAIGTETDGSITCPASLNGVVGLKPTVGAVSTTGVVPLSSSQDSPGPMGRSVADVALLLEVLTGRTDVVTGVGRGGSARRVAVATTWMTGHDETDARFADVVAAVADRFAGVVHRDVAVPNDAVGADELAVLLAETADDLTAYLAARGGQPASLAEVVQFELDHRDVELAHFGHEFFVQALATGGRAGDDYAPARARNLAWAVETCLTPALAGVDVLLAPTYGPAWKCDLILGEHGTDAPTTCAPAIAGWPIATVPMGLVAGLPVGLGIVGRPGSEAEVLEVASVIEATLDLANDPSYRPSFTEPRRG